ncbi:MAG: glycosyltransferase, partial [Pseudomonadota bacterium]
MAKAGGPIDILLATYNGEAGLPAQLASLEAQSHTAWRLIARDDGSTDGTVDLLRAFSERHPEQVEIVEDTLGNLRTLRNFATLLGRSESPYCVFCDQDDVWDTDKLAVAFDAMEGLEARYGEDAPLMAVTDRRLTDPDGTVLAPSFWRNQGVHPNAVDPRFGFFVYPCAAGSSMLMNAALRALAQPIPDTAIQQSY